MNKRVWFALVPILAVVVLPASATGGQVLIASGSSYDSCTADDAASQPGVNYPDSLVEPHAVVNPTNPSNIVTAHQQDRFSSGGSRGDVVETSFDGGATWTQVIVPDIAVCDGGPWTRGTDPWLAFTPTGDLYLVSQSFSGFSGGQLEGMVVVRSTDGGLTWNAPLNASNTVVTAPRYPADDKVTLTADPFDPYTVYMVFDRYVQPTWGFSDYPAHFRFQGQGSAVYFTKTSDAGQTWSTPVKIYTPGGNNYTTGPQIAVLADRTLVMAVNAQFYKKLGKGSYWTQYMMTSRSTNGGSTWTMPSRAVKVTSAQVFAPPYNSYIRAGGDYDPIVEIAHDNGGRMYMTWQDGGYGKPSSVVFSESSDRGIHWTAPVRIDNSGNFPSLNPMIAVAPNGTIGVSYFDYRYSDFAAAPVSEWLVRCSSNCTNAANWSETALGGATTAAQYDLNLAPYADGLFLGDYQGLTATASGFQAVYALPGPGPGAGNTGLYFSAVP